jgi:hypothetical protein
MNGRGRDVLKKTVALLAMLGMATTASLGAMPTAGQKLEFHQVCLAISGDDALCTCKADAAMTLIDERMMGFVIAGMKGSGGAPDDVQREWNDYVARSNQICKPNY